MPRKGTVFIVSAPSGAGKSSILSHVLAKDPELCYSVSATTRAARDSEKDGHHYKFVDEATFERWIAEDRFAEWARVHGAYYGTLQEDVEKLLQSGRDVILEIDVQGARTIREKWDGVVSIFIAPPTITTLEDRLRRRGDMTEATMATRLGNARAELAAKDEFDYVIENDALEKAIAEFEDVLKRVRNARNGTA